MIGIELNIDKNTMDNLQSKLSLYSSALGKHSETASRRAAIMICKSFRKNTKQAKKNKTINITKDNSHPTKKYITYSHGRKLATPLRRYQVDIVDRGKHVIRYADTSKAKQQLRKQVGTNYKPTEKRGGVRGLAKMSWGWVMHNLFSANPDLPFHRRRKDNRNPKDATKESTSYSHKSATSVSSFARISNKLEYIVEALKGYTPQQAIDSALKWMTYEIERLTKI